MTPVKVFISYSHDSAEHRQNVLRLANTLRSQGVDVELDQYHVRPPQGWPRWCEERLLPENADRVLVICTHTYRDRVENRTAADEGRGVFWEGGIVYSYLYEEKANTRFIPVLLPGATEADIPRPLKDDTRYYPKDFNLNDPGYHALYRELTDQPAVVKPPRGEVVPLPPDAEPGLTVLPPLPVRPVLSHFNAWDIDRIGRYAPARLIGREEELALLDAAWDKAVQGIARRPRVLTFVAMGGEGKTSLAARWAVGLAEGSGSECEKALAWSFYSQGARDAVAASSDTFFKEALTFFGEPVMATGTEDPVAKGRRLAHLVGGQRSLLILDGLEPLQYPPGSPLAGELKDHGVSVLLKALAVNSRGLCVVTTRYPIPDLTAYRENGAPEIELLRLSKEAGRELLKGLGVRGPDKDMEDLVDEVKGHALTLQILGGFLKKAHGGDIRRRDRVRFRKADATAAHGHAFRAMEAYDTWMMKESGETRRERALLRLMGLFDRPVDIGCLKALTAQPTIPDLTEPLADADEEDILISLDALETARLLTVHRDGSGNPLCLDAHPLLREYFAHRLETDLPESFRTAHQRVFEHLCATTQEGDRPTLEDLQPLYQAVAHGCRAGMYQEACDKVYHGRIKKGREAYSAKKLGAFGSDLGAVACFFEKPWHSVATTLTPADQSWLLNEAAISLRALGRLTEALEPMRVGLKMRVKQESWENAARSAGNLSGLALTLGDVAGSVAYAEQAVAHADRSGDDFLRMGMRTTHADALHQAGRHDEALALFREAELMQGERQPDYPLLYSLWGFGYGDLLLAGAEREAGRADNTRGTKALSAACVQVSQRAGQTLKWVERQKWLLDIALDHLTLARAALYRSILENTSPTAPDSGLAHIDQAVSGLRRAGQRQYLPSGLITRAWFRSLTGRLTGPESAQSDLDEAWGIAQLGPMPLFQADIHLYRARLFFRRPDYPWDSPETDLIEARRLIEKHGYGRRRKELDDAENAILKRPCT